MKKDIAKEIYDDGYVTGYNDAIKELKEQLSRHEKIKELSGEDGIVIDKVLTDILGHPPKLKDSISSRDSERIREIRENRKEECEHNLPFWECEICANQKKPKEETSSKLNEDFFYYNKVNRPRRDDNLKKTVKEKTPLKKELMNVSYSKIPKSPYPFSYPIKKDSISKENNDPNTCNEEVDCKDCYHKEHCGDLPINDDKKSTGLPDAYKPIREINVRRKDYKKLKKKRKQYQYNIFFYKRKKVIFTSQQCKTWKDVIRAIKSFKKYYTEFYKIIIESEEEIIKSE